MPEPTDDHSTPSDHQPITEGTAEGPGHGHGEAHAHAPHLAHHFETPQQQYDTSKLGMWIFLATEMLMFSGLFCAYAIYRGNHPDVFLFGRQYLDTNLAVIGTVILLLSSFTMTLAVRAASSGNKPVLLSMLILTIVGAFGFAGIELSEYYAQWHENMFVGGINVFYQKDGQFQHKNEIPEVLKMSGDEARDAANGGPKNPADSSDARASGSADAGGQSTSGSSAAASVASVAWPPKLPSTDRALITPPPDTPIGINADYTDRPIHQTLLDELVLGTSDSDAAFTSTQQRSPKFDQMSEENREKTHIFFQLFYLMTGLHLTHVFVGVGLLIWVTVLAFGGKFSPQWYTPVDVVGLYWHLVDMIWVFLFPMLYLIH